MTTLSLRSIKRENTRAVLEAIARKKHITKLELSEETGLSLMTVGKIVSTLGANGIILHAKNAAQKAGRRAEVFRIRHDWLIPVFEISSRIFKFYITDLEGNVLDKVTYRCTADLQNIPIEFVSFLKRTLELLHNGYRNQKALGIGVSVAGIYDEQTDSIQSSMLPELSSIKLMQNIRKIFKQTNIVIDNANRLCATGIIEGLSDYKERTISCLTVDDSIECTTCDHGYYLKGSSNLPGRLGDMPYAEGGTYANFVRISKEAEFVEDPILDLLKMVSVAYDPDTIYLCSSKFSLIPATTKRLKNTLHNSMIWLGKRPELIYVHSTELESMSGIISRVIGNWLDTILDKDT